MERVYKDIDEIMYHLEVVPVLDNSGMRLNVFLEDRKVGRIDEHTNEIALAVKVAAKENSDVKRADSLDSYWEYSQSTGQLTHVDNQTGERTTIGTGYSGNGAGYNNSNMQKVREVGPIPQGVYDIGPQRDSRRTGSGVMDLTPRPWTNTFNRDNFQIHGDNACRCQSASRGCIILDRSYRDRINNSGDRELRVVQ